MLLTLKFASVDCLQLNLLWVHCTVCNQNLVVAKVECIDLS